MNIDKLGAPTFNIKISQEGISLLSTKTFIFGTKVKVLPWNKIESAQIKKRLGTTFLCLYKKNAWMWWNNWYIPLTGASWDNISKGIKLHAPNGHPLRKLKAIKG
ncbi:hypothetical protein B9G69_015160 [Bdellovibrio sp. SKB1291214]|uniref:hypothetical protein n=1 Tax=Bdellovibrio sp. SKB1291214 TaxID=1732569 RepID=UPI000B51BCC9|nr:hypothetical protein [Bdellovibrio sp. SKB1291214]UYL08380.1 hypothetical protein B9G69_015160 [Bdellovibrio sp. SKB1291214]